MKKRLIILTAAVMMALAMPFCAFAEDAAAEGDQQAVQTGWSADHKEYYDENGEQVKDAVISIDGKLYLFDKHGRLSKKGGWRTVGGERYYVRKGSPVNSLTKIKATTTVTKRTRYYYNENTKKWQKKYIHKAKSRFVKKKVKETKKYLYMFRSDGRLIKKKGLFKYKGKEYFGRGNGMLKTGWVAYKNKAMYFYPSDGSMAKNTKIKYLKIPKSGRLGKAYALGVQQLDRGGWSLREAYRFAARTKYADREYRAKNAETYAIRGFTKRNGNCYVMAATFYVQAMLMGYDAHMIDGWIIHDHSWVEIVRKGEARVYDPNFTNETGRDGYNIYYGKHGTWKYRLRGRHKKRRMN